MARSFVVEAESEDAAWEIVDDACASSDIILDADDYVDRDIVAEKLTEKEIAEGWWDDFPTWPQTIEKSVDEREPKCDWCKENENSKLQLTDLGWLFDKCIKAIQSRGEEIKVIL